jgi:hypothetical protein
MLAYSDISFDHEASVNLARRVRAQHRRCWRNAALAVSHLGAGAAYVEGWIVSAGARPHVIEHGWCEYDGRIIDPTYAPHVTPDDPPAGYFAGARFTVRQAEISLTKRLPIVWGAETRTYWLAFESAWREATRRARLEPQAETRVVHCRREAFDIFIGRPTQWANPFHFDRGATREQAIAKFCQHIMRHPSLLRSVWTLRGKALGCRCAPLPCHGDVLARLADVERYEPGRLLEQWVSI